MILITYLIIIFINILIIYEQLINLFYIQVLYYALSKIFSYIRQR